jgi:amino acid adenylation domain-containing protein
MTGAAPRPSGSRISRRDHDGPLPLSYGQEQVWFFSQLSPEVGVYNEAATFRKRGALDPQILSLAFDEIVRRHQAWRTRFEVVDGRPVQRVQPPAHIEIPLTDLTHLPSEEREPEAVRLVEAEAREPYDLSRDRLIRPHLVRLADDDHRFYLGLNHIVFDAVSIYRVVLPELAALYEAFANGRPSPLPELELQFGDLAVWERERADDDELAGRLERWRRRLGPEVPGLSLPLDHERPPIQSFRGAVLPFEVEPWLASRLKELGHAEGASLFMVLAAVFTALLQRCSGQEDIVFGTPLDQRSRPELASIVGFCLNAVVLRVDASGDPDFLDLLARVRKVVLDGVADAVPFGRIVRELQPDRDLSRNPLFQAMFTFEPSRAVADPEWSVGLFDLDLGAARFDLTLEQDQRPDGQISARFIYNTDLFERETVERLQRHWLRLLKAVAGDPSLSLSALPLLDDDERRQLLVEWNSTGAELPASCTHELISAWAKRTPEACAAVYENTSVTHRELEAQANRLALRLCALGVGPNVPVGICLQRSLRMLVAVLGVWKAGGAYLPLDPSYPPERLAYMLDDSEAPVLVTEDELMELPKGRAQVVRIDEEESWCTHLSTAPEGRVGGDDLAYLIYTSGSTGKPKGVEISHRALVNFLSSMAREPGFGQDDVLVAVTTLSFDIAGLELYLPLLAGGKVVIASGEVASDGRRLGQLLADSGATFLQATPATWRLLLESGWTGSRSLTGLCGGEAWGAELAAELLERCCRLYNVYGPTETTIWSTMARVIDAGTAPSIGRPLANTELYVLDRRLQPVPIGVPGELYIGGAGLARGYWKRPELTAERFVASPWGDSGRLYRTGDLARFRSDGDLEYLGRLDQQVKVRGFRIEPGEVEAALLQQPHIARAAVMVSEERPGDRKLVAYLVPEGDPPAAGELKAQLRGQLPEYMVPSVLVFLDRFPLTPNGKLDRKALPRPELEEAGSQDTEPQTPVQIELARIWTRVLGMQRVSLEADFFDLGGHSLLGTRLATRVREVFGVELPLRAFFQARTVEAMAALIEQESSSSSLGPALTRFFRGEATVESLAATLEADRGAAGAPLLVNAKASGSRPPLFFIFSDEGALLSLRHFLPAFPHDQPVYGLVPERKGRRFDRRRGIEDLSSGLLPLIGTIQPAGPYHICGHSLGGLLAYDLGRQLGEAGEDVRFLGVVDALTPAATARWMRMRMSLRARLGRQFRRGFREGVAKLWEVADRHTLGAAVRLAGRRPKPVPEEFDVDGAFELAMRYCPRGYSGRIVVFWTDSSAAASDGNNDLGWSRSHEGPLERVHVPGDHLTLLQEPQVAVAAEAIAGSLGEAHGLPSGDRLKAS